MDNSTLGEGRRE